MQNDTEKEQESVSIKGAATLAGCSERTVHNRIASGKWRSWLQTDTEGNKRVQKRHIAREDVIQDVSMKQISPGETIPESFRGEGVLQGLQSLQSLEVASSDIAEELKRHNDILERQGKWRFWSVLVTAFASLAMLGAALWYGVRVLGAAGVYL